MTFAHALANNARHTYTENGARAMNSTSSKLLDFFASAGALRNADKTRVERLFADALSEDKLLATKALFYTRDVRGGLGERKTFRTLLEYAAKHHPEIVENNIDLIGEYGRYDDLYTLVGTPLESNMWDYVKGQLESDVAAMKDGEPCSLLAKWLKTADASSPNTRKMGIATAKNLGMSVYDYKRCVRALRKHIDVTEVKMSTRQWDSIDYEKVPSRSMLQHKEAFKRHDAERYQNFIDDVAKGNAHIKASTLYPYDIVEKYGVSTWMPLPDTEDATLEAQWKALPDYVGKDVNALVIADTSGSMSGRPMNSAVGLAIYFAQRNTGAYHNLWMSFSEKSEICELKGETLLQNLKSINMDNWGWNTNLEGAFEHVLDIAIENNVSPDEMVKSLIVISDMEIDACNRDSWSFYDAMAEEYAQYGYDIPNVVFWNVDSRQDTFHADANRKGVQLCSGQSSATFAHVINSMSMTPIDMMLSILESERYDAISINKQSQPQKVRDVTKTVDEMVPITKSKTSSLKEKRDDLAREYAQSHDPYDVDDIMKRLEQIGAKINDLNEEVQTCFDSFNNAKSHDEYEF